MGYRYSSTLVGWHAFEQKATLLKTRGTGTRDSQPSRPLLRPRICFLHCLCVQSVVQCFVLTGRKTASLWVGSGRAGMRTVAEAVEGFMPRGVERLLWDPPGAEPARTRTNDRMSDGPTDRLRCFRLWLVLVLVLVLSFLVSSSLLLLRGRRPVASTCSLVLSIMTNYSISNDLTLEAGVGG